MIHTNNTRKSHVNNKRILPFTTYLSCRCFCTFHIVCLIFLWIFQYSTTSSSNKYQSFVVVSAQEYKNGGLDSIVANDVTTSSETADLAFDQLKLVLTSSTTKKAKSIGSKERIILDGSIRGRARPGRMLAIMGPSGAGKSSILHALGGRIKYNSKLKLYGTRSINGNVIAGDAWIPAAFIEQDVNFFPYMTVRETLSFRVELKLGSTMNATSRNNTVSRLLDQMKLTQAADTIVGNTKVRGISGGERKRLSIAVELISSPSIVFLDEPTSGLDSTAAMSLVRSLRELADTYNKTIVAVIHQPSQYVFANFDDLLLVSEGRLMYYGDRSSVRSYMEETGGCVGLADMGTAELILDCITRSPLEYETLDDANQRMDRLASHAQILHDFHVDNNVKPHSSNNNISTMASSVEVHNMEQNNSKSSSRTIAARKYFESQRGPRSNVLVQFRLLFRRSLNDVFRGKTAIVLKLVQQITTALIYGGIYNIGTNQASIMDRFGLLNLIIIGTTNLAVGKTIRTFPREKSIVNDELSNHLYRTLPYFVGKLMAELPMAGFFNVFFGTIVYFLTGLNRAVGKFRTFSGLLMLHGVVAEAAGLFIGAISPNTDVALAAFPAIIVLSVIFDGRNISEENTPRILRWISKVGLIRWGFEGLCINEFDGLKFDTPPSPLLHRGPPAVRTGADALARFGMGNRNIKTIVQTQLLLASSFWILSYLGLTFTKQTYVVMQEPPVTTTASTSTS